jgi:hypothetical protein
MNDFRRCWSIKTCRWFDDFAAFPAKSLDTTCQLGHSLTKMHSAASRMEEESVRRSLHQMAAGDDRPIREHELRTVAARSGKRETKPVC